MATITVWMLLTFGSRNDQPQVLERFPTLQECERVLRVIDKGSGNFPFTGRCIQATIAR